MTAHLATAMLLFGLLITIAIRVQYPARLGSGLASQRFTVLAAFTAACVYALLLFGAEVRGSGAALVFSDWPLFNGQLIPTLSPDPGVAQLQALQFLHRLVALVAGLVVLWAAWVAWRRYERHAWGPAAARPTLLLLVGSSAALFLIQSIVGAAQIFTDLAAWAEALHVGARGRHLGPPRGGHRLRLVRGPATARCAGRRHAARPTPTAGATTRNRARPWPSRAALSMAVRRPSPADARRDRAGLHRPDQAAHHRAAARHDRAGHDPGRPRHAARWP